MSKYLVSYLLPTTKHPFSLTMKNAKEDLEEKRVLFEKHIEEYSSKAFELVSSSNLGYGIWFFWKKV